jgi:hypothetical protein
MNGQQYVDGMTQVLGSLHDEIGQYLKDYRCEPVESSAAVTERRTFAKPELISTVHSQGIVRIELAGEHMIAFTRSLMEPVLVFAPWVSVRALLEASAIAVWLLDPTIDVDTRVRRSYSVRFDGLNQQKAIANTQGDQAVVADIAKRVAELATEAKGLGYTIREDKGAAKGIDPQFPGFVSLVKGLLKDETFYRIASGVAHSYDYAITRIGYVVDTTDSMESPGAVGNEVRARKTADFKVIAVLCSTAMQGFAVPIRGLVQLYGWDMNRFAQIMQLYGNELGKILASATNRA